MDKCYAIEDITKIALSDLHKKAEKCVAQRAYVLTQIALLDTDIQDCHRKSDRMKAIIAAPHSDLQRWKIDDMCATDPKFRELYRKWDTLTGTRQVMEALATGLSEKTALLSRELTRRNMEAGI